MDKIEVLKQAVESLLGDKIVSADIKLNELTVVVEPEKIVESLKLLRDHESTKFEQCVDLCGVDYLDYKNDYTGSRFAVVYHLLSYSKNWRIRLRTFAKNDEFPMIDSAVNVYSGVNWFEREAFDMYGIVFEGHPDLRRILTDYGFIGHPFRKDFPLSGYMEMRYDDEQKRVIYQPVTIEPREITPRVIREENYCGRN